MAKEIERKYLVRDNSYKSKAHSSYRIIQGYLSTDKEATIRIRICDYRAFITIKGLNNGIIRNEWEYEIPMEDAKEMIKICKGVVIDKTRYNVDYCGFAWEIDEFHGVHSGLVLAEIEIETENDVYPLPQFVGEEVSGNAKYYNSVLSKIQ